MLIATVSPLLHGRAVGLHSRPKAARRMEPYGGTHVPRGPTRLASARVPRTTRSPSLPRPRSRAYAHGIIVHLFEVPSVRPARRLATAADDLRSRRRLAARR